MQLSGQKFVYAGDPSGNIKALLVNPAVKEDLLSEIFTWKQEGATLDDIATNLRMH